MEILKAQAAALREQGVALIAEAARLDGEAQQKCKHLRVIESDTYSNEFGMFVEHKRKCIDCGLKETAHHNQYKTALKDADFVKRVGWTEI